MVRKKIFFDQDEAGFDEQYIGWSNIGRQHKKWTGSRRIKALNASKIVIPFRNIHLRRGKGDTTYKDLTRESHLHFLWHDSQI